MKRYMSAMPTSSGNSLHHAEGQVQDMVAARLNYLVLLGATVADFLGVRQLLSKIEALPQSMPR
jgi:hypothetical protein